MREQRPRAPQEGPLHRHEGIPSLRRVDMMTAEVAFPVGDVQCAVVFQVDERGLIAVGDGKVEHAVGLGDDVPRAEPLLSLLLRVVRPHEGTL